MSDIGIIEAIKGVKARIVRKSGPSIADRILFEAISVDKLSTEDIALIQMKLGYHPGGYGGPWNISSQEYVDGNVTTWTCSACCD